MDPPAPQEEAPSTSVDLPLDAAAQPAQPKPDPSASAPFESNPESRDAHARVDALGAPGTAESTERPLNVTDALSYLDAVKTQFTDRPDVYNHFLDIMKDFKSSIIDTPGVIARVSDLFNGHPMLIQGFNTFLPVGYRIECTTNALDVSFITVTTPSGTTTQTTNTHPVEPPPMPMAIDTAPKPTDLMSSTLTYLPPQERADLPQDVEMDGALPYLEQPRDINIEPALEFVQTLKHRYDAETYHEFLELLRSGSRDQAELFAKVEKMLHGEADLLNKFRNIMLDTGSFSFDGSSSDAHHPFSPMPEPKGTKKKAEETAAAPSKRKRKVVEKDNPAPSRAATSRSKKAKQQHEVPPPTYPGPSSPHRHLHTHAPPVPVPTSLTSYDESRFFDRVRRYLDSREAYHEFLKTVNLFTQDIIDRARLVREARTFLGDTELLAQLKELLGWDDARDRIPDVADMPATRKGGGVLDRPGWAALNVRHGSYRRLPAGEASVACSGRDEMCRAVLNDAWVSHPAFASEDAGFAPHRKTTFEEALHRTEEERHEYDFHIDAVARTIHILEPISAKIAMMAPEDRATFKLKPNLGGVAKPIHHRVVKKIYGREAGTEVMQAMQESPSVAIPVVLSRLRQKEEEWRRAQREWNKVWREVDARAYPRSLDRRGVEFRAADKKAIAPRALLSQIETARQEQRARRAALVDPLFARTRPKHQFEFAIGATEVLQDTLKLVFSLLDRMQGQLALAERKRVEAFLRTFLPCFLMLDTTTFNATFVAYREVLDGEASDDVGSVADDADTLSVGGGSARSGRSGRKGGAGGGAANDLRKKLLKSEQAKSANRKTRAKEAASPSPAASRRGSPSRSGSAPLDARPNGVVPTPASTVDISSSRPARRGSFFANTNFYVMLRLLELLYSRVLLIKETAQRVKIGSPVAAPPNQALPSDASDTTKKSAQGYEIFLDMCERLFDNEIEQLVFEDQMRSIFGSQVAYNVFTIDKLIGALIKQVQTILADTQTPKLIELLKRERDTTAPTAQEKVNYQWDAKNIVPDDNLFRIDWHPETKAMTMQLLGKDDDDSSDDEAVTERWQQYVEAFVSTSTPADGLPSSNPKRPFLRRNLARSSGTTPDVVARGGLEIKVCVRTYRLFFVSQSEDSFLRLRSPDEYTAASKGLKTSQQRRHRWLNDLVGRVPADGLAM